MFLIGIDESECDALIARAAAHLPIGATLGKIHAVSDTGQIMAYDEYGAIVVWSFDTTNCYLSRLAGIGAGLHEYTRWRHGQQLERAIIPPDAS